MQSDSPRPVQNLAPMPRWLQSPIKIIAGLEQLREPRAGDRCPACQDGTLDYDGLLNLSCPRCGYTLGGCFT